MALATLLGGCAKSVESDGRNASSASPAAGSEGAGETAAASGGPVGAAGSACELPVRFDIAKNWKAKAIDAEAEPSKAPKGSAGDVRGSLPDAFLRQGSVTAACEIDAKPAGHIGFLRVWTGTAQKADAGSVLREFVAAEDDVSKQKYHSFTTSGGLTGVEVEYLCTSAGWTPRSTRRCGPRTNSPSGHSS